MKLSKKGKRRFAIYCALVLAVAVFTVPAYATDDPIQVFQVVYFLVSVFPLSGILSD